MFRAALLRMAALTTTVELVRHSSNGWWCGFWMISLLLVAIACWRFPWIRVAAGASWGQADCMASNGVYGLFSPGKKGADGDCASLAAMAHGLRSYALMPPHGRPEARVGTRTKRWSSSNHPPDDQVFEATALMRRRRCRPARPDCDPRSIARAATKKTDPTLHRTKTAQERRGSEAQSPDEHERRGRKTQKGGNFQPNPRLQARTSQGQTQAGLQPSPAVEEGPERLWRRSTRRAVAKPSCGLRRAFSSRPVRRAGFRSFPQTRAPCPLPAPPLFFPDLEACGQRVKLGKSFGIAAAPSAWVPP